VWRNLVKTLKGIHGGKHGKKIFIKMNGGLSVFLSLTKTKDKKPTY
jgi:hypothetical protein